MADTDVGICAKSLVLLGVPPISSFTEEPNGPTCEEIYAVSRDTIIAEYPWRFGMQKSGQLGRLSAAPDGEWKFAYQLPPDIAGGLFTLFDTNVVGSPIAKQWEIFGKTIHTDYENVFIDYRVVPSEALWPAYFDQLVIYEMAWKLADAVTEDDAKQAFWFKIARGGADEGGKGGYYRTATQIDAMGNTGQEIGEFTLIQARFGGR